MDALEKAIQRSQGVVSRAHSLALTQKQSGLLTVAPSDGFGHLANYRNQGMNRQRYGMFRGWLYAAINAIAQEGAGQSVCVGKVKGVETPPKKERGSLAGAKTYSPIVMPGRIRTKAADQGVEIVADHPLLDVLQHPNPVQNQWQFTYSFIANLLLTGWSYVVGGKTEDGGVEFYSLPTTWIKPIHKDGPFSHFKIINPSNPQADQDPEPLTRENVAFGYLPDPSDPLKALAPVQSQINAVRIDDHIQVSQERFFENGIFPSVIVTIGNDPHPEVAGGVRPRLTGGQRRQVIGAIRKAMGGVANYGNPAIVDGLIERIDRLSATQNEMGWDKSEDRVRTRILSSLGVHPYILGEPVSVGGYAQAAKIEERFCKRVNTYLDMLGGVITNFAAPMMDISDKMLVWWEECAPHDPSLHWQNIRDARSRDDITQNEYRAMLGLPPDEDRNESVINKSAVTGIVQLLGQVGQGVIDPAQAQAILEGMGLPTDLAKQIAGKGPPPAPKIDPQVAPPKLPQGEDQQVKPKPEGEDNLQTDDQFEEAAKSLKAAMAVFSGDFDIEVDKILDGSEVEVRYNPRYVSKDFNYEQADSVLDEKYPGQPRDGLGRFGSGGGSGRGGSGSSMGIDEAAALSFGKPVNPKGKDTKEMHTTKSGKWSPEREKLHDAIVADVIKGKTPVDNPTAYFMGGGPASGKSYAIREGGINIDKNTVHIDTDIIKAKLPEYSSGVKKGNLKAAAEAHEESSYLAKRILKEASAKKFNTMVDGTGNSSIENITRKIQLAKGNGSKIVANYVTVDTKEAVARNVARAEKTGRYVPEAVVRGTHANVSRVVPKALKNGLYDEFNLYDTNGGKVIKVASAKGSKLVVHDQANWDRFVKKANE